MQDSQNGVSICRILEKFRTSATVDNYDVIHNVRIVELEYYSAKPLKTGRTQ